jgi:glycosyltransferase involved in cell wall biosynthesis
MTSVHMASDIRIFHKECASLVEHGFEVHLVAKGHLLTDTKGVIHHELPAPENEGRLKRMAIRALRTYQMAKEINADLYHLHDPELLPYGLLFKWQGKRVIYDAHEDLPRDVMTKAWIPRWIRKPLAWTIEKIENTVAKRLDATVTATPHIRERFKTATVSAVDVKNFPRLSEFCGTMESSKKNSSDLAVCYVGLISEERGIIEMVHALETIDGRLILAGQFINQKTELLARSLPGWKKVDYRGLVSRQDVANIFSESVAGICVFHPSDTHNEALPNKLFEYMAAGLPVIASDFKLWRGVVENAACGICVDPLNVHEVRNNIKWMFKNLDQARAMGLCGRKAIEAHYSWEVEAQGLVQLYGKVLGNAVETIKSLI